MSILRSVNAGMGDRPIDSNYLQGNGWHKVPEDSDDKVLNGINYINDKYPNLGLVPYGDAIANVVSNDIENAKKNAASEDKDYLMYWCLFVKTTCGIDSNGNVIDFETWEPYSAYRFKRISDLREFMKSRFLL